MQRASQEVAAACRDTYATLVEEERGNIQRTLYDIQQIFDFHQFEAARHLQYSLYKRQSRQLASKKKNKFSSLQWDDTHQEQIPPPVRKKRSRRFKRRDPHQLHS